MNQFRNDGEMPPEMATQFPVLDQWQPEYAKPKSKEPTSPGSGGIGVIGGVLNFVMFLLIVGEFAAAVLLGFAVTLIVIGRAIGL